MSVFYVILVYYDNDYYYKSTLAPNFLFIWIFRMINFFTKFYKKDLKVEKI